MSRTDRRPTEFSRWLQAQRQRRGITLREVAEACGVRRYQTPMEWEQAKSVPSPGHLQHLADLYGAYLGEVCAMAAKADVRAAK